METEKLKKYIKVLFSVLLVIWLAACCVSLYQFARLIGYDYVVNPMAQDASSNRQGFYDNRLFGIFYTLNHAAYGSLLFFLLGALFAIILVKMLFGGIGKNIVKVLLDNYGYTVIDLGRDVDPKVIVETALKEDIEAVGLSALMTTTLSSMEETIALLRKEPALQNADGSSKVNVMVGGAVVTPDYAERIGADFYCRDAKATVDACKSVFKN